jgi:hypothetical protein
MKDFDRTMVNRAANYAETVAIDASLISKPADEFRTLGWQSERHSNPCHIERSETPLVIGR